MLQKLSLTKELWNISFHWKNYPCWYFLFSFHILLKLAIKHRSDKTHNTIKLNKVILKKSRGGRFLSKMPEIWAGLGPVGNTKKNWADNEQLLRAFFHVVRGKENVKNILRIL